MQVQNTYWLEKVLKMNSLYVNALLCTLQHIVIHAMQLRDVNSPLHFCARCSILSCTRCNSAVSILQCTFVHAAAHCHTRDATQRCQFSKFSELTPLSCIACMTICCSVHKSALRYKEIIFSTFSNQ